MSRRLRLLLISYFFPPAGGPAVQRPEMLLRYLPDDVEATVIAATTEDYEACSPLRMPLDASRFGREEAVLRVPARGPYRLFQWLAKFRLSGAIRWCFVPDVARNWARDASRLAADLHRQRPFDVIFSTAPPFSAALAGQDCARRLGIPWVCDLRDLWTGYLLGAWPSRLHYRREEALEKSVLAEATTVIMVTPGSRRWMLNQHPFLDSERVECITNGFDASDFPGNPKLAADKFIIAHTGVFCGPAGGEGVSSRFANGRAFQPRSADRRTHSPAVLVRAMELLRDPRVEFRHVGPIDSEIQRLFQSSSVRDQIMAAGYRDHRAALVELMSADAAYLCLATCRSQAHNELIPQKTYEYLGARKPVLAPIQDGDAKDFLRAAGTGIFAPPGDASALAAALRELVRGKFDGRPAVSPQEDFIRCFEWSRLAGQIFQTIERAATGRQLALV